MHILAAQDFTRPHLCSPPTQHPEEKETGGGNEVGLGLGGECTATHPVSLPPALSGPGRLGQGVQGQRGEWEAGGEGGKSEVLRGRCERLAAVKERGAF